MKNLMEEVNKRVKSLLNAKRIEIGEDLSESLVFKDIEEQYLTDENGFGKIYPVTEDKGCSPFCRINIKYIIYHDDSKCSLVEYKAFAIIRENIELIDEKTRYILKGADKHMLAKSSTFDFRYERKTLDVFLKDNSLHAFIYLDGKHNKTPLIIPFKGRAKTGDLNSNNTFYSIQGNKIYMQTIHTGKKDRHGDYREYLNYVALETTLFHRDKKEIADVIFIDTSYKSCGDTETPETTLALIVFTDGTKRFVCKNGKGVKNKTRYFDGLRMPIDFEYGSSRYHDTLVYDYTAGSDNGQIVVSKDKGTIKEKEKILSRPMNKLPKYPRYGCANPDELPF